MNHTVKATPADTAGRLPPHDLQAERAVLSTLMVGRPHEVAGVVGMVEPLDMYSDAHRWICEAARELVEADRPTDVVTVADALNAMGKLATVGGPRYLAEIFDEVPSSIRWQEYARIVVEHSVTRRAIAAAQTIAAEGYGELADRTAWASELPARIESAIRRGTVEAERLHDLKSLLIERWRTIEDEAANVEPSLSFGHAQLDRCMGRWRPGSMTVIAARSHVGKSSLARQLAMMLARRGAGALVWSGEQPAEECADAIMAQHACVPSGTTKYTPEEVERVTRFVKVTVDGAATVEIHDAPRITGPRLKRLVRAVRERLAARGQALRVVVVDYFQLMGFDGLDLTKNATSEERLGALSKYLKSEVAMGERVALIVAAQLNKDGDRRSDGLPRTSDMRGSSALEQDADKIILLHNPEAVARATVDRGREPLTASTLETCYAIFGKARQGGQLGTVPLAFLPAFGSFFLEHEPPRNWDPKPLRDV